MTSNLGRLTGSKEAHGAIAKVESPATKASIKPIVELSAFLITC